MKIDKTSGELLYERAPRHQWFEQPNNIIIAKKARARGKTKTATADRQKGRHVGVSPRAGMAACARQYRAARMVSQNKNRKQNDICSWQRGGAVSRCFAATKEKGENEKNGEKSVVSKENENRPTRYHGRQGSMYARYRQNILFA